MPVVRAILHKHVAKGRAGGAIPNHYRRNHGRATAAFPMVRRDGAASAAPFPVGGIAHPSLPGHQGAICGPGSFSYRSRQMNTSPHSTYEGPPAVSIAQLFEYWAALRDALDETRDEALCNALSWAQCRISDDLSDLMPRTEQELAMQLIAMSSMGEIGLGTHLEVPEFWDYAWKVARGNVREIK